MLSVAAGEPRYGPDVPTGRIPQGVISLQISPRGRIALIGGLVVAVVAVALFFFLGGDDPAEETTGFSKESGLPGELGEAGIPKPPKGYGMKLVASPEPGQPYYEFRSEPSESEAFFNIVSYYQAELPGFGWVSTVQDGADDGVSSLRYERNDVELRVDILANPATNARVGVRFTLCPPQEAELCEA